MSFRLLQLLSTEPISDGKFISTIFTSDTLAHGMSFPKFVEVLKFLEYEYLTQKQEFHGIVFTETRSAVHHLAAMLKEHPRMNGITFIEFTGHGRTKASKDAKIKGEETLQACLCSCLGCLVSFYRTAVRYLPCWSYVQHSAGKRSGNIALVSCSNTYGLVMCGLK